MRLSVSSLRPTLNLRWTEALLESRFAQEFEIPHSVKGRNAMDRDVFRMPVRTPRREGADEEANCTVQRYHTSDVIVG